MDEEIRDIARRMGATIVAELPPFGHGGPGAAHYAAFYRKRQAEIRQLERNRDSTPQVLALPIDASTLQSLETISQMLAPTEQIEVAKVAAGLLRGMARVVLDQLIKQMESDASGPKRSLNTQSALIAALKELIEGPRDRQAAG